MWNVAGLDILLSEDRRGFVEELLLLGAYSRRRNWYWGHNIDNYSDLEVLSALACLVDYWLEGLGVLGESFYILCHNIS